jgi:hypothetical protein
MPFIDLSKLADLFVIDILLPGTMPEHILDMKRIAI